MISPPDRRPAGGAGRRSARDISRSLLGLTEPRVVELLLVTAIPALVIAQRGLPPIRLVLVTLTAGALAAGSANTINSFIAGRTCSDMQPVIKPAETLAFGIGLGATATVLLGTLANWLAATLADAAIALFVVICTLRLKRRSSSGIAVGAAVGCFPVLADWSAVTGTLSPLAIVALAVIFCWMPPRFWALVMDFRGGTAAARVAVSRVALTGMIGSADAAAAAARILWYACVMVAATVGLAPYGGWVYTLSAVALGAWFLAEAHRLRARAGISSRGPIRVHGDSAARIGVLDLPIACLAQLFAAVMAFALLSPTR